MKTNKSVIMFGKKISVVLLALLVIGVVGVSAALLTYFGKITTTVDVEQAVTLDGIDCSSNECSQALAAAGGETITTNEYTAESQTSVDIPISIVSVYANESGEQDGGVESIITSYNLYAGDPQGTEDRIRIEASDAGLTDLNSLNSISFSQNVLEGYIGHVDVRLEDKTLVFEYAKVDPADCDDVADYPSGQVNTFGDKGILDDDAYAWLSSGLPGPCGDAAFDANHKSLADWKTSDGTTTIVALEFEVDSWIATSNSKIKDIEVNGVLQDTITIQSYKDIVFEKEIMFANGAIGQYTIETEVQI